jgi:hypothetical protein
VCSADLLYNQAYDGSGGLLASQNDTSGTFGAFATTYDNFTLPNLSYVTGVAWTGGYFNPPTQGTITAFTLQFYSDNAGTPGPSVYSTFISGTAGETLLGGAIYTYSATLGSAFTANAGTQYWLSIVPDLGFPPQWGWADGTGGDGAGYQVFFGAGAATANDMAFTLTGIATPEPFTFGLIGVGLAGIALAKFRRARS